LFRASAFATGEGTALGVGAGVAMGDAEAFGALGLALFGGVLGGVFVAQPDAAMSSAKASAASVKVACEILFIASRLLNIFIPSRLLNIRLLELSPARSCFHAPVSIWRRLLSAAPVV
jgi:hypothetical protein